MQICSAFIELIFLLDREGEKGPIAGEALFKQLCVVSTICTFLG